MGRRKPLESKQKEITRVVAQVVPIQVTYCVPMLVCGHTGTVCAPQDGPPPDVGEEVICETCTFKRDHPALIAARDENE